MASRIEDYALIGDSYSAALVARDGAIDWLCLPRFDSGAVFAALLGTREHGRWLLAPRSAVRAVRRRYREGTLVLETDFETADGAIRVVDFMPKRTRAPDLVRVVEGLRGQVPMSLDLLIRCDYGSIEPWVQSTADGIWAIAGPDSFLFRTQVPLSWENGATVADFVVSAGQHVGFTLTWHPSHEPIPPLRATGEALMDTEEWWRQWSARCTYTGPWRDVVRRSLITLKALTYAPTGGIVAAPTTSLPEQLRGVRNWDYRYCWLRDSTFTLLALLNAGYREEAQAWRRWLLRAVAGTPAATNIMYGLAGERRLTELELEWLPGYDGARPVRIGNAASRQLQLDIYGEVLDAMYQSRRFDLQPEDAGWRLEEALVAFVETAWESPDEGIWEVRGPRRHFTHSKVMAWVALDRAVKAVEHFHVDGPVARWRGLRDTIHEQVCRQGFDPALNSFVQSYGTQELDASLLLIPLVGFLPASDPRVRGTVAAIERHLVRDGLVHRYTSTASVDGLPPGEGAFLACTCWLADTYKLLGRNRDARRIFERLLALRNDVGLLSEEYDLQAQRLVGNFPQALSHIGLVTTAMNLSPQEVGPAEERQQG
jgi:GH15 family glucan-1,4-alpha-glucosidase